MGGSCSAPGVAGDVATEGFVLDLERQKIRARARRIPHRAQDPNSTVPVRSAVSSLVDQESSIFLLLERCQGVPAQSQSSSLGCACASAGDVRNRPFVKAFVKDSRGQPMGEAVEWSAKANTRSPTWFTTKPLRINLAHDKDAVLHIELWDGEAKLGALDARLGSLPGHHDETLEFLMEPSVQASAPCSVTFQVLDSSALTHARTVYFVRHGESVWNAAQSRGKLHEMAAEFDHPLTAVGARQAEELRKKVELGCKAGESAALDLSSPGVLLVSPLCRAVQTGLIALGPSQVAHHAEFVLMSSAREKQNFGGLDSMSKRLGSEILQGAVEGLRRLYPGEEQRVREEVDTFRQLRFDVHDAEEQWWCAENSDSAGMLHLRLQEFMAQLLYTPHDTAVVVGHSHFFRAFFKSFLSEEFAAAHRSSASDICSKKLMNCGVAKLTLDPRRGIEGKPITKIELVLGTTLEADGGMLQACCAAPGHAESPTDTIVVEPQDPA